MSFVLISSSLVECYEFFRDSSNLLLRCLLILEFFCLRTQHCEFINFARGLVASMARFNVGAFMKERKQMRERVVAENTEMQRIQTEVLEVELQTCTVGRGNCCVECESG